MFVIMRMETNMKENGLIVREKEEVNLVLKE
jgi:hypothetical protein